MFGSVVLDVAIGMVFVFLLLSLIASTIHEILATLVKTRAINLYRGLYGLFSGGKLTSGVTFVEGLYTHGLIQGLYRNVDDVDFGVAPATTASVKQQPEETERRWAPRSLLSRLMGVARVPHPYWAAGVESLPAYIPSRTFALALVDMLNTKGATGKDAAVSVRTYLLDARTANPGDKTIEALLALTLDAGDNLSKLQSNFEDWYNDGMDRVSGWYKKNTQYVLLAIGLLLAIAFNVNSIEVAQTLWFDRDVRQTMVDEASKMHEQIKLAPTAAGSSNATDMQAKLGDDVKAFKQATDPLFPVGWHHEPSFKLTGPNIGPRLLRLSSIVGGWIITALAISLGAPFWFDLLNKFMVVRGTVKPQEKSQTEDSKDGSRTAKSATAPE